jgi:hypothetical protein
MDQKAESKSICTLKSAANHYGFSWRRYFGEPQVSFPYYIVGTTTPNYPYLLPLFRLTCALYLILLYILFLAVFAKESGCHFGMFFFFLTNLGVFALLVNFLLSGIESYRYARNPKGYLREQIRFSPPAIAQAVEEGVLPTESVSFYLSALHYFYATVFTSNFFIAIMYWGIVFWLHTPEEMEELKFHHWLVNVSIHGLNFLFALTDLFLSRQRIFPILHYIPVFLASISYCIWSHIGHLIYSTPDKPWYVYRVLNIAPGYRVLLYLCMIFSSTVFFVFTYILHGFKEKYWPLARSYDYLLYHEVRQEILGKLLPGKPASLLVCSSLEVQSIAELSDVELDSSPRDNDSF